MNKRINRLRSLNMLFYIFNIITIIYIQTFYIFHDKINQNIIGILIFVNSYIVSFYIIYNIKFSSFSNKKISDIAKFNMLSKYFLFMLSSIMIINKFQFTFIYVLIIVSILIVSIFDNIMVKSFFRKVVKMISEDSLDIDLEEKENRIKIWDKSKEFKKLQFNLMYFIISLFFVYGASFLINFTDWRILVLFLMLFSMALLLGFKYCQGISKYIHIKWFEYIIFEIFYGLVLIILCFKMTFLTVLAIIPLIPIIKKENFVRKKILAKKDSEKL